MAQMAKSQTQTSTTFSDAFPGVANITLLDNSTVTFQRLDLDELSTWCTEMHKEWKAKATALIPPTLKPVDRFQIQRNIEFATPTLDDIADSVFRPDGVKRALSKSLMKGGMAADKVAETLKLIPPVTAQKLARWVVALFKAEVPETPPAEDFPDTEDKPIPPNVDTEADGPNKTGSVPPLGGKEVRNTGG